MRHERTGEARIELIEVGDELPCFNGGPLLRHARGERASPRRRGLEGEAHEDAPYIRGELRNSTRIAAHGPEEAPYVEVGEARGATLGGVIGSEENPLQPCADRLRFGALTDSAVGRPRSGRTLGEVTAHVESGEKGEDRPCGSRLCCVPAASPRRTPKAHAHHAPIGANLG
jgi:hypothetical protein